MPPASQTSPPTLRNGGIDYARFLGAIGIVWFHMHLPGAWLSYAALPMFTILLIYFGWGKSLADRYERLLIPWLIWCVVFALLKIVEILLTQSTFADEFKPWMLLTGTAIHLWFLPFSFLFLAVARAVTFNPIYLAIPISVAAIWASNTVDLAIPFKQWANILPAAFVGLMLCYTRAIIPVSVVAVAISVALYVAGFNKVTPQLIIAVVAIAALMKMPIPVTWLSETLGGLSLGIYLIHPIAVFAGLRTPLTDYPGVFFVEVIAASIMGTLILQRIAPVMVGQKPKSALPIPFEIATPKSRVT